MASNYFRCKKSRPSILRKRILSLITVLSLSALLFLQAYAYTSLTITPITMGYHNVPESSGTVASRAYSGIYWMISDWMSSGNILGIHAVNSHGDTIKVFTLNGASNWNWEDIAIDSNNNLWICDIGDNNAERSSYKLYKVPEPNPYGGSSSVSPSATYSFKLSTGPADMDSCFIWQGTPYVITNSPTPRLYRVSSLSSSSTVTAELLASWSKDSYIGGADISKDGRRLALAAIYSDNQWVIERSSSSTNIKDFFTSPTNEWKIHFNNGQGEGIAFVNGKYDFVTVSENGGMWLVTQSMYDSSGSTPTTTSSSTTTTTTTTTTTSTTTSASSPSTGVYTLSFQGYDFDNNGEVSVLVNNQVVATLPTTNSPQNNDLSTSYSLDISKYVVTGSNKITFEQNIYSSAVQNVKVTGPSGTLLSDSSYRNLWTGGTSSVTYSFDPASGGTSGKSYRLYFDGYDYDNLNEVTINLNGTVIASLPSSYMSANNDAWTSYSTYITASVVSGTNSLIFKQNIYSSCVRNLRIVETSSGQTIYSDSAQRCLNAGITSSTTYTFKVS